MEERQEVNGRIRWKESAEKGRRRKEKRERKDERSP
jgi:hypothetical protein